MVTGVNPANRLALKFQGLLDHNITPETGKYYFFSEGAQYSQGKKYYGFLDIQTFIK